MQKSDIKIQKRKVSDLTPSARNSRTHSDKQVEQIAASIKEFGFVNPVLVDSKNGIIAGHGRVMAAAKLGMRTIPVVVLSHLSETQIRALMIADNRIPLNAGWDLDVLRAELVELNASDFDADTLGFSDAELQSMLCPEEERDEIVEEDESVMEPTQIETSLKLGDLIELGRHKLVCGDCTDSETVERLMKSGEVAAVDLVFTDPLYAIYGSSTGIAPDITDDKMVRQFFRDILANCAKVLKPFGHAYICCDWRSWSSWWEMAKGSGLSPKNMIVWDKGGGLGSMFANNHELIMFLSHRPLRRGMRQKISGERTVNGSNVWRINRANRSETGEQRMHNAQKPLELPGRAIDLSTKKGETVVDFFLGSGTTLIACEQRGRTCLATEIEPRYCQLAINRYRAWCEKSGTPFSCFVNGEPYL